MIFSFNYLYDREINVESLLNILKGGYWGVSQLTTKSVVIST